MTNARSVWRHRRWAFWLMLMLVVVIGIGFIAVAARAAEQDIRAELLDQARRMAAAIDPHLVSALSGTPADLTAPEYVRLKEQLTQTRQAFPDARFLYLMGQHPDGAVFIFVDSETPGSEDESSPGDIYWEATDDILDAFSSQRARTYPPFDDRWGSWVSALVPLVDPATDDIQAVFGIDVSTQDWRGIVARRLVKPVGFAVMLTVGAVAGVALLYRRARLPVAQRERRVARYAEALVIGTIGLTLTSMLAYEAVVREDRSRREGFARLAEAKTYSVSETLHGIGSPGLIGLASLFASSRTVEPQEFHSYIGHLSASPTVQAWGWVLSVRAEDLTSTEESIRREGPADYAVWELDHQGVRRPVSAREVYYPIRYTRLRSHAGDAGDSIGFDLGSRATLHAAMEEAARTGMATASVPTNLPAVGPAPAIVVFHPVFSAIEAGAGQAQTSPGALRGFAVAVIDPQTFLSHAVWSSVAVESAVELDLYQLATDQPPILLASTHAGASVWQQTVEDLSQDNGLTPTLVTPVLAFGKAYAIIAHPGPAFAELYPARAHRATVLTGIAITSALVTAFGLAGNRRAVLEREVHERTAALRESEERYRTVADHTYDLEYWIGPDEQVRYISPSCERITGYRADLFVRRDDIVRTIVHPDDRETVDRHERDRLRTDSDPHPHEIDFRIIRRDGEVRWLRQRIQAIRRADGTMLGVRGSSRDITDQRQAEIDRDRLTEQLASQAREVQEIIDTVPEGVILLDSNGTIRTANPAAQRLLTALVGSRETSESIARLGDHSLEEVLTSPPQGLWHEVHARGQVFEVVARPMDSGSDPERWVLVLRDVTRDREVRSQLQQQERLAAVGQLAAGIAHDFNNIMAVIVLYAHTLSRAEGLGDEDRERAMTISREAQQATHMIQQLLDFSRRGVLERQPIDLLPLLKEQVKLLRRTLPESIEVALDYEPVEYTVQADPTRIQQLLMNLAVNARDAMPDGGVLKFALELTDSPPQSAPSAAAWPSGTCVVLKVSDTGTGIASDILPHIFEPFFTTKPSGQGTGLGLAQVDGIVAQHGGRITVDSQSARGTTFTIVLPAPPSTASQPDQPDIHALDCGHGECVLVVEDRQAVRDALRGTIEMLGYRTIGAGNGAEALRLLEADPHDIDLVISDVVMPALGGVALLHALRQRGDDRPVILLTGHSMGKDLDALLEQGLTAWLSKPPSMEHLAGAIAEALHAEADAHGD